MSIPLTQFAEAVCPSRVHCGRCRDRVGGRAWRVAMGKVFELPEGGVDFACPSGVPWRGEAGVRGQGSGVSERQTHRPHSSRPSTPPLLAPDPSPLTPRSSAAADAAQALATARLFVCCGCADLIDGVVAGGGGCGGGGGWWGGAAAKIKCRQETRPCKERYLVSGACPKWAETDAAMKAAWKAMGRGQG